MKLSKAYLSLLFFPEIVYTLPAFAVNQSRNVSRSLFNSLEELARIVDISYCVGSTGIQKPFRCLSRCRDFENFELITVSPPWPGQISSAHHTTELEHRTSSLRLLRIYCSIPSPS